MNIERVKLQRTEFSPKQKLDSMAKCQEAFNT